MSPYVVIGILVGFIISMMNHFVPDIHVGYPTIMLTMIVLLFNHETTLRIHTNGIPKAAPRKRDRFDCV